MTEYSERFRSLHRTAYLSAYPVLGDPAECQDVAQEAMARAYVRWATVALEQVLRRLPRREAVSLRYVLDLSAAGNAEAVGISRRSRSRSYEA